MFKKNKFENIRCDIKTFNYKFKKQKLKMYIVYIIIYILYTNCQLVSNRKPKTYKKKNRILNNYYM